MTLQDRLAFFEKLQQNSTPNSKLMSSPGLKQQNHSQTQQQNDKDTSGVVVPPTKRVSAIRESFLQTDSVAKGINNSIQSYRPSSSSSNATATTNTYTTTSSGTVKFSQARNSFGGQTSYSNKINTNGVNRPPSASVKQPLSAPIQQKRASFGAQAGSQSNQCGVCSKTVFFMEQILIDDKPLHKTCLKCDHCKMTLKLGTYASLEGKYYCKPHFKQLFKLKGNYFEGFGQEEPKKQWQQQNQQQSEQKEGQH